MRINTVIGTLTLTLAAGVLAACGSSSSSDSSASGDYCQELKADKAYFETFSGNNPDLSKLDQVFQRMHTLAGDAPSDVAADWKTLDDAITTIESALKDAGLKASDLAGMQNGQVPKGVDISKLQALAPKLQALNGSGVSAAAQRISKNAKDTCGIDLTSS
jgi:ABC-type phosphate/phosphonate transport system substrate-binding protein